MQHQIRLAGFVLKDKFTPKMKIQPLSNHSCADWSFTAKEQMSMEYLTLKPKFPEALRSQICVIVIIIYTPIKAHLV